MFVRSDGIWAQQAYLKASGTDQGDYFGTAVAIDGDTIVVGAEEEDGGVPGVNGDDTDNSRSEAGAAYVFVRSGGVWSQEAYLKASNPDRDDVFGGAVSVSGDTVVVGARREDSSAFGVNGNQADDSVGSAGAAYVFVRDGTQWSQEAYLKAANRRVGVLGGETFGHAVGVSGDSVVVGAPEDDSAAVGINGDDGDFSAAGSGSGAAHVFVRSGSTWSQQAYIKAHNTGPRDQFGYLVALSGDRLIVGAPFEDSVAAGVNGSVGDDSATDSGAAYTFVRRGADWSQQAYIKASNTEAGDRFGWSLGLSEDTAIVGAWREDSAAVGVNGDGGDNSAPDAGAAYVFDLDATAVVITGSFLVANEMTIRFTGEAGVTDWRVMSSSDLGAFKDDRTGASTIIEMSPGHYEAVVQLGTLPDVSFLRIER